MQELLLTALWSPLLQAQGDREHLLFNQLARSTLCPSCAGSWEGEGQGHQPRSPPTRSSQCGLQETSLSGCCHPPPSRVGTRGWIAAPCTPTHRSSTCPTNQMQKITTTRCRPPSSQVPVSRCNPRGTAGRPRPEAPTVTLALGLPLWSFTSLFLPTLTPSRHNRPQDTPSLKTALLACHHPSHHRPTSCSPSRKLPQGWAVVMATTHRPFTPRPKNCSSRQLKLATSPQRAATRQTQELTLLLVQSSSQLPLTVPHLPHCPPLASMTPCPEYVLSRWPSFGGSLAPEHLWVSWTLLCAQSSSCRLQPTPSIS